MSKKIYGIPVSTPINPAKVKPDVPEEQIASNVAAYMERNPVTPSGIGLGNVDNTADKDKPVSTAQAVAIADAKKAGTDAQTAANNAQQTANDAVNAAGNAQTAADNAQQAADDAQTSANNAQSAADNAQAAADNAQTSANNAQTSADNAQASANNAQNVIDTHIADKNNPHKVTCEQIGATSMTLLWKNASPTSIFTEQTVPINWAGYDFLQIICPYDSVVVKAEVGQLTQLKDVRANTENSSVTGDYRYVDVVADGVFFSNTVYTTIWGYGLSSDRLVPYEIYGINFGNKVEEPEVQETGNLLDNSKMLDGYRITSDGTAKELASAICSEEYIDISKAQGTHLAVYVYNKSTATTVSCYYRMCFYDANKNKISYEECPNMSDIANAVLQIPTGAVYARVSFTNKNEDYVYMVVRGASDMPLGYYD